MRQCHTCKPGARGDWLDGPRRWAVACGWSGAEKGHVASGRLSRMTSVVSDNSAVHRWTMLSRREDTVTTETAFK
jgi:hypothetical protein